MGENSKEQVIWRSSAAPTGDRGLNAYMQKIYFFMALGVGISGVMAYFVSTSQFLANIIFRPGAFWLVALAPLLFVIVLSRTISKISPTAALLFFAAYAASVGVSLSSLFLVYTHESMISTFLIVTGLFSAMSIYGYTTKKDLTSIGAFLMMGVLGLIIVMIVNIFMQNTILSFALSALAVVIFTGVTAYDVQRARLSYDASDNGEAATKKALIGALLLYMDFVNLFIHMLRLLGNRR
jgi:FtsH-binding integral membrane protein